MFDRVGEGGTSPSGSADRCPWAGRTDGPGEALGATGTARRLSKVGGVRGVAFAPGWWAWEWEKQTALLVDGRRVALAHGNAARTGRGPAFGTGSARRTRVRRRTADRCPSDGTVAVTLLDEDGERDLGLFDPVTPRVDDARLGVGRGGGAQAPATLGSLESIAP